MTVHITTSVGWIGAVATYLIFDVTVATTSNVEAARAAFIAMDDITTWALLPLGFAAWATGLVMALGTKWGLMRHYWVLISFILTTIALIVLIVESSVISDLAGQATSPGAANESILTLPHTLPHSIGGLAILLFVNALNIVKPRGLTKYGWRKAQEEREGT